MHYAELSARYARSQPGLRQILAAYISIIGVDIRFVGQGYGGDLLVASLDRIANAAEVVGIAVVMLDILDCGSPDLVAKRLTLHSGYGFVPLPPNPLRLFLPLTTVRILTGS